MRMFAGPNGSGKSTLKSYLRPPLLGVFLNPDEIEEEIRKDGFLDFSKFGVQTTREEVIGFFTRSSFLNAAGLSEESRKLSYADGRLGFSKIAMNSYFASVAADFLRQKLLEQKLSFTIETVMSHRSKVNLLAQSQSLGYRAYLYFVATDDPAINISRVRNRVALGGHAVPEDKSEQRYYRALDLLMDAIRLTNRAYIFDNSGDNADCKHTWLAEITDGKRLELKTERIPAWFKRTVLDKISE